jgi:hypothetical protein
LGKEKIGIQEKVGEPKMPSPFPGMDPYLEVQPFWSPLHANLITAMQGELKKRVPRNYSVWSDVYIWLHEPDAITRKKQVEPDVFLSKKSVTSATSTALAQMVAPFTALLPALRRKGNRYLKIMEANSDQVITVIELLSPTNKRLGEDREAYLAKRNEYLANRINLVEIDLHRAGRRMPLGKPTPPDTDYYALICRAIDFPKTAIWPFSVRDRLPELPIPLKPEDGIVTLPLQPCFDFAYDIGPYDNEVDYGKSPRVPLTKADAAWAKRLLASTNNH